jgi:hypothetical protein
MSVRWRLFIIAHHALRLEGACIHSHWMEVLSCCGRDVDLFPAFNETIRRSVTHIDILNTSISQIPNLSNWYNLFTVDIRDNVYLNCDDIHTFKVTFTQLLVLTDCADNVLSLTAEDKSTESDINPVYSLVTLPFLCLSLALYLKLIKKLNLYKPPAINSSLITEVDVGV